MKNIKKFLAIGNNYVVKDILAIFAATRKITYVMVIIK